MPSVQPYEVAVVAVNTFEPVSDSPLSMAIFWNAFSFMPGNWAMISPLATLTTPLASVVAASAEVAAGEGGGDRGGGSEAEEDLAHCFPLVDAPQTCDARAAMPLLYWRNANSVLTDRQFLAHCSGEHHAEVPPP